MRRARGRQVIDLDLRVLLAVAGRSKQEVGTHRIQGLQNCCKVCRNFDLGCRWNSIAWWVRSSFAFAHNADGLCCIGMFNVVSCGLCSLEEDVYCPLPISVDAPDSSLVGLGPSVNFGTKLVGFEH